MRLQLRLQLQLLFALFMSLGAVLSYASPALDLWDVWQLALQNDPIYAAQKANTQANQEQINQARADLLPSIDAVTSIQHQDVRRVNGLNQSANSNPNQWQLRLRQPLLDLVAIAQFERSRYLAAIAVFDLENAKNDLFLRVSQVYFDVLATQDSLTSLAAQHRATEQQLLLAQYEFELGGATITDSYEAQARLDLLNAQLITTENDLQAYKNSLSRIVGTPIRVLAPLNPNAELPEPIPLNLDAWVTQANLSNLLVAKASIAVQAQQEQLKANQRQHAPIVSLQAVSGSQSNQGIYGPNTSPRALNSSVGIELSIPLYKGGGISSKVRENASILQQKHFEHENARRAATEQTQQYFNSVNAGIRQVKALKAAEQSSESSVQANQTAYEVGVRNNIDVLDAQQQLYETQRALARARYNTLLNSLRLKNAAGQLQDDDIAAISRLLIPAP